jgi:RsiW-degrading membrane proteinase PrsW (M82 family)
MIDHNQRPEGGTIRELPGGKRAGASTFLRGAVIPAVLVITAMNLIAYFQKDSPESRLQKAIIAGNNKTAAAIYRELIAVDFSNIEYHRGLIRSCASLSERTASQLPVVLKQYRSYTLSDDLTTKNIGWYGVGYAASLRGNWPEAMMAFEKVQNRQLPYLNNSLGCVYLELADGIRAEAAFRLEIELDGFKAGACANLARLYYLQADFAALDLMMADPNVRKHIPGQIRRIAAMKTGRLWTYIFDSMRINYVSFCGLIASAIVMVLWFGYMRGLDVFEPEPMPALLLTLGMGMAFSTLCVVWYDIFDVVLGLRLGNGLWQDFVYCVAGIGLIEETLKIIPFLLMLRFSRQFNESLDYIIYASTAALGFAFMENLLYFQDPGLGSIVSRTFSAVLMHISLTTFAAYGLFYARYKKQGRRRWVYFAFSFAAAVVVHGVYDFWLLAEGLDKPYTLLSLVILVVCVQVFSKMVKNGLNQSEFNPNAKTRIEHRTQYLVYFLSAVFLLQYVLLAWRCGAANANIGLAQSAAFLYFPLLIVFGNLGTLEIHKNEWVPLFGRLRKHP